jgi:hypothetical protein
MSIEVRERARCSLFPRDHFNCLVIAVLARRIGAVR